MPPQTPFMGCFIHSLNRHSLSPPDAGVFKQVTVQDVFTDWREDNTEKATSQPCVLC